VLSVKNPRIGPSDAATATLTTIAAMSSRSVDSIDSRQPTSALKTYSDGNVTASVTRNSAGSFTVDAITCM
jgi:hypothetical protein